MVLHFKREASFETPLKDIPALFEKNELKEASRIELENITGLPVQIY